MRSQRMKQDIINVVLTMAGVGALAGVAALLRSKETLNARKLTAALLNSALFTAAISALMLHTYGLERLELNLTVSILAGLGGNTTLGIGINIWKALAESNFGNKK